MASTSVSRLWIVPLFIHGTAAVIMLSYNIICRSYFQLPPMNEQKLRLAAAGYFLVVSAATSLTTSYLVRNAKAPGDFAAIPLWRALFSTICWLGLIPVLGFVATVLNGQIDPVQFPNFCISVIIGWLISTSFTVVFYAEEISLKPGLVWSQPLARLLTLLKTIPYFGTAIPLISAFLLLVLIKPNDQSIAGGVLNNFLVGLYTASAYGVFFLSRKASRIGMRLKIAS